MQGSELAEHRHSVGWHDSQLQLVEAAMPASALFSYSVLEESVASDMTMYLLTIHFLQL